MVPGFRLLGRSSIPKLEISRFRSERTRAVTYRDLATMELGGGCNPTPSEPRCEQGVVLPDG